MASQNDLSHMYAFDTAAHTFGGPGSSVGGDDLR